MAKARPVPGLAADAPFGAAAAAVVSVRAEEVFAHAEGVLDVEDIERVHAMRVATRRLRAVLEVFAPCFPRREHRRVLRDVKALADALGARRDPDVHIAALEAYAAAQPPALRRGPRGLAEALREEQAEGNRRLAEALEHAASTDLRGRLAALAATARGAEAVPA